MKTVSHSPTKVKPKVVAPCFSPATIAGCRALTGKCPDDLLLLLEMLYTALRQVDAVFGAIEKVTDNPDAIYNIRALAGAGRHVAEDMAGIGEYEHEELRDHMMGIAREKAA